jgi:hypothetical protein
MSSGNPTLTFASTVSQWVAESQRRMEVVFHEATQDLIEEMQTPVGDGGNMPIDTGFLRASIRVTLDGLVPGTLSRPSDTATYTYNPAVAVLAIVSAQLGDTIYASYTANYARVVHYGSSTRQGRQWITMAAQRWPQIVTAACNRLASASAAKGKANGGQ